MKKAKIIVALVLLTFSLSGCANAERFEVYKKKAHRGS